jgi:uncharacterized membrane protein
MSTQVNHQAGNKLRGYRQAGSMAVNMMLMLVGLVGMLALVEVGYLYWAKRDTQKVADLASLAGAQQLQDCNVSNSDNSAARGNAATENHFGGALTITCGTWDPVANAGITDYFAPSTSGVSPNAVKVVASRPVTPFFAFTGALPGVQTEAVATQAAPAAAFSIGSTLVGVNGAASLQQFLQSIGINLSGTSLAGYQGLANVTITPAGLLQQLGITVPSNITVGGMNTLLAAQTNVHALIDVLNAIVTVGGQQQLTSANANLLSAISAAVGNIPLNVTLGSSGSTPTGLFAQIVGPSGTAQSALNTQVNALQLLNAAIGVATNGHAIYGSPINITTPLGINVNAATSVIEPPSVGIGGVGTTAYTAQIRTFIDITTPTNGVSLIGGLLKLSINLPIAIDLVNAQATLTSACSTTNGSGQPQATIAVNASVLKMCVGNITQAGAFSTALGCDSIPGATTPQQLLNVSLASTNLATLNTSIVTNALPASGSGTLVAGQTAIIPQSNPLAVGTSVNNLVNALSAALLVNSAIQTATSQAQTQSQIATDLWNNTNTSNTNLQRVQQALGEIQTSSQGFQGLLGNVTSNVTSLLGNTVLFNVPGLLSNITSLLTNVTNVISGILGDTLCTAGSTSSCINVISDAMNGGGTGTSSNAFVGLLGFLLQDLQQPLDDIGSNILSPVLTNTLGLDIGQNTVNLQSLECHRVQLVY